MGTEDLPLNKTKSILDPTLPSPPSTLPLSSPSSTPIGAVESIGFSPPSSPTPSNHSQDYLRPEPQQSAQIESNSDTQNNIIDSKSIVVERDHNENDPNNNSNNNNKLCSQHNPRTLLAVAVSSSAFAGGIFISLVLRFGRWLTSSLGALLSKLASIESRKPALEEGTGAEGTEAEAPKRVQKMMLENEAATAAGSSWHQQERQRRRQQTPTIDFRGQSQRGPQQTSADSSDSSCAQPSFGGPREFATQLQQQQYRQPCWGREQLGQLQHDIQAEGFKYAAAMTTCATAQSASSGASTANACQGEEDYYYSMQQQQHNHHKHHQQQHPRNGGAARASASVLHYNANLEQETGPAGGCDGRQVAKVGQASDGHHSSSSAPTAAGAPAASLVLVSKATLNELTDQIAFSMNRMKDLEAQVRVIPELQKKLEHVMSDGSPSSVKDSNQNHLINYIQRRSPPRSPTRPTRATIQSARHASHEQDKGNSLLRECNDSPTQHCGSSSSSNDNNSRHIDNFNIYQSKQYRHNAGGSGDEDFIQPRTGFYQTSASLSSTPIHRRYHSFRCSPPSSTNNDAKQANTRSVLDAPCDQRHRPAGSDARTRTGSLCTRSPTFTYSTGGGGVRDYQRRSQQQHVSHAHSATTTLDPSRRYSGTSNSISTSRQSFDSPSMLRQNLNQEDSVGTGFINNLAATSTPKVEYEDLINDLISLSYSVNYLSPTHQSNSALSHQSQISNQQPTKHHQQQLHHQQQQHDTMHNFNSNNNRNNHRHHQNLNGNHQKTSSLSYLSRGHYNGGGGSLSLQPTPARTPLDCGCLSFKEHLRYNTISREQRLNQATKSQSVLNSNSTTATAASNPASRSNTVSPQLTPICSSNKCDASTNTDLVMEDIFTRNELENVTNIQRNFSSNLSSSRDGETSHDSKSAKSSSFNNQTTSSSSISSEGTTDSMSGSSSSVESPSLDSDEDEHQQQQKQRVEDATAECSSSNKADTSSEDQADSQISKTEKLTETSGNKNDRKIDTNNQNNNEDDNQDCEGEVGEEETNGGSLNCEEPYSLGSSYLDPSDFEEYCAYGESLDRRTKDFMSQSTKIPNDLRFALIRLGDFLKRKDRSQNQIESSSGCIEVIRKEWFEVAANKDSQPAKAKLYVEYFESFTKQLLNVVVNLVDTAGNTAMHYAASHYKLDIIKVLLGTKVCDINCRNKAGYTPIMLLALAEINETEEREIARLLFSMGDVNIKARSSGQTALMLASSHGRISTCKLLLECGADPSLQDYDGSTALMCGSEIGNEEVVRCLLAHPLTDPTATDNDGLDALTIAMNNKHKNVGLLLYAATNVPRMARGPSLPATATASTAQKPDSNSIFNGSSSGGYLGASLRRSRGKMASNFVRRADSLLGSRTGRPIRRSGAN